MNISLTKLVNKSNFKHYYFIIDAKEFEENSSFEIKLKGGYLEFGFSKPEEAELGWKYYNLARCINIVDRRANHVANYLEQSKMFDFEKIEIDFDTQTAYIYLTRRQK